MGDVKTRWLMRDWFYYSSVLPPFFLLLPVLPQFWIITSVAAVLDYYQFCNSLL